MTTAGLSVSFCMVFFCFFSFQKEKKTAAEKSTAGYFCFMARFSFASFLSKKKRRPRRGSTFALSLWLVAFFLEDPKLAQQIIQDHDDHIEDQLRNDLAAQLYHEKVEHLFVKVQHRHEEP